ncbi:MAG TPA: MFS transporter [Blastocatellia bacterium]|nr:MFS transporter [Blastocatellia bacterium]
MRLTRDQVDVEASSPGALTGDAAAADGASVHDAGPPLTKSAGSMVGAALLRSIIALLVGSLILRLAAQTMSLMLQSYFDRIDRDYFRLSHTTRGFILASFFVAELLGSQLLGALSDRYGRRRFIILGPVFGAIAVQITSMTMAIWLLVITRLLEGLSTASAIPATLGYISEITKGRPKLRARVIGLFEITFVGGMAIGAEVGKYLWTAFGQEATVAGVTVLSPAFSINGLIYLVSVAVFVWGLRLTGRQARRPAGESDAGKLAGLIDALQSYRAMLRSPRVWMLVPAWLAINSFLGMWLNHFIGLLTGKDRYGQLLMGYWASASGRVYDGYSVLLITFAAGVLAWSFVLGRYRRTSVMLVAVAGLGITLPPVYGLNHLGPAGAHVYPLVGLLLIGVIMLSGFAPAALTYLADVTEAYSKDRGSIMGLYTVFLGVGQLIGAVAGGFLATHGGIDGLLLLSAIFGAITALTLVALRRREPAAGAPAPISPA